MKKPEKLFLLINEISDRFVDEAKDKAEKPVSVRLDNRMPIKEIIAFAACFAVLSVGIFAFVKYKLNSRIDPPPVDNDSSNQSFELNSGIELNYTEQDKELQAILKDLTASAEDIDRMFNHMSFTDGESAFENRGTKYYLIPNGTRTEPNGLFDVPQTCDEMENLVSRYFSRQAAEFYTRHVCKGSMTQNSDGTLNVEIDGETDWMSYQVFVEIDGKMYRSKLTWNNTGLNLGIDCDTARVIRKTDKSMEFSYWGYDYTALSSEGGDTYSERNGALVYDDGAWKLNYFCYEGFISEMPAEYTEQDLELQKILETLAPSDELHALFSANSAGGSGTEYRFNFPKTSGGGVYIDVSGPQPSVKHPKSLNELEQRLMEYFAQDTVDSLMSNVCKGTMGEYSDGSYSVTLDKELNHPVYIEINGKMFYRDSAASGTGIPYYNTAKVIDQTDDTIIFSYTHSDMGYFDRVEQRLIFERGGWKRDLFYSRDTDNPPEESNGLSADDKELQGILTELVAKAREIDNMFTEAGSGEGEGYELMKGDIDCGVAYYPIPEGERTKPNGLFVMPQNRSEMEKLLLTCFTQRAVKEYMNDCGTGSLIMDSDGKYFITVNQDMGYQLIEVDGRLYRSAFDSYDKWHCNPETAHVISKTDKTICFSYSKSSDWDENEGAIVYENGGWKLNYFHDHGFIPELPTEFTEEDLELQEIMNVLSTGFSINSWFYNGYYNSNEHYEFVFPESNFDSICSYCPLPEGKSKYGDFEYPKSRDEFEKLLLKYFTREAVDKFMSNFYSGTMTENSDGRYSVITDKPITWFPPMLEIDGRIYFGSPERGGGVEFLNTVKVIDKTDDSIRFSYIYGDYGMYFSNRDDGLIKYERGGWKLNYFYRGFINDNGN